MITYYTRRSLAEADSWTISRQVALGSVLAEIEGLTGLRFRFDRELGQEMLVVYLIPTSDMIIYCGDDGLDWTIPQGCARWDPHPYPSSSKVYLDIEAIGEDREQFKGVLRHELLHALFGFLHATRVPSVLGGLGGSYEEFQDRDKEMLRLYGAIPSGLSWEEIQRRACIGEDGVCVELYKWNDEPWWTWNTTS